MLNVSRAALVQLEMNVFVNGTQSLALRWNATTQLSRDRWLVRRA